MKMAAPAAALSARGCITSPSVLGVTNLHVLFASRSVRTIPASLWVQAVCPWWPGGSDAGGAAAVATGVDASSCALAQPCPVRNEFVVGGDAAALEALSSGGFVSVVGNSRDAYGAGQETYSVERTSPRSTARANSTRDLRPVLA